MENIAHLTFNVSVYSKITTKIVGSRVSSFLLNSAFIIHRRKNIYFKAFADTLKFLTWN